MNHQRSESCHKGSAPLPHPPPVVPLPTLWPVDYRDYILHVRIEYPLCYLHQYSGSLKYAVMFADFLMCFDLPLKAYWLREWTHLTMVTTSTGVLLFLTLL